MAGDKQRVIFYIDGFNFYFGLRTNKWKKYYWLDMVKFCNQFIRPHQELIEVNYFSAIPKNGDGEADRQDLFFTCNKLNPLFHLHLGKFLKKKINCYKCKQNIKTHEEKETDVRIATNMIRDVVLDRCDVSILVSADSDLIPPITLIRELNPTHKILVYFPPKRASLDLEKKANGAILLENHQAKFDAAILPETTTLANGYVVTRPPHWK